MVMVLWELKQYFSTFHMSTVVIVYETNSCDGRVGAKPTGQDINGSLSGCYITHLKHRIFLGKWPFDMIYGVILQTPSCPTRLKCTLGLLLRKVPERNIFSKGCLLETVSIFSWTGHPVLQNTGLRKSGFWYLSPCLQTLNIFCGLLSQPTNKKKQKLLENLVLYCWQVSKCQSEPFLRHFSCRLQFV